MAQSENKMAYKRPYLGKEKEDKKRFHSNYINLTGLHNNSDSGSIDIQATLNASDDINDFFDNDECDNICSQLDVSFNDNLTHSVKHYSKSSHPSPNKGSFLVNNNKIILTFIYFSYFLC